MMAYLAMMAVRLIELRRVLKPTGSLYLHCRIYCRSLFEVIMDSVFGHERFMNDVTWKRTTAHNDPKRYGRIQDRLLFYAKGKNKTFNHVGGEYSPEQLARYKYEDSRGRYKAENLTAPHFSPTRTVMWRGVHPGANRQWRFSDAELDRLYEEGAILLRRDGRPRKDGLKEYLSPADSPALQDIWTDIKRIGNTASERLGYPTQKPLALLERIISVSSNQGEVVLDPFCGCGTTVHAAQRLERQWIGVDVTHYAVTLIESRLKRLQVDPKSYEVVGRPVDFAGAHDLARRDKHQFQWWAAWRLGARWYREEKKGADRGIDGRMMFKNGPYGDGLIIISVKGGENVGVQMVRDLRGVIEREDAQMGIMISLVEPTGPMKNEAAAAGFVTKSAHGRLPRLQIVTIEEILDGHMPILPPLPQPERIDRIAPRKKFKDQLELLLPFAGDKVTPAKGDFVESEHHGNRLILTTFNYPELPTTFWCSGGAGVVDALEKVLMKENGNQLPEELQTKLDQIARTASSRGNQRLSWLRVFRAAALRLRR